MWLSRYSRWPSRFHNLHFHSQTTKQLLSSSITTATTQSSPSPLPPPMQVALTDSAGRGVFATRRICAGDLIHTAKPIVSHPSLSSLNSVCYFCLRRISSNSPDFEAHSARFCSQECAENSKDFFYVERTVDWSTFDDYCRDQGLKYPLLVKRLACMIISGSVSSDSIDILQPARLSPEMISKMEEGFHLLRSALRKADVMDEELKFLNKQWYISVLARIRINAFRIELAGGSYEDLLSSAAASIDGDVAVGNAVYMLPSFYNHDCDPNSHIIWIDNADARLKALRDVEGKSFAYAILMQVWVTMLGKLSWLKDSVFDANALGVYLFLRQFLIH
ncbi:histone-lysine N-methyltransferase ATXR4 isoform X3 [Mangifera indica]|uniref:histone-lysine N-methyltransferase ATXR4 isoform X3 n=1 Tax=Mangifera indica TaxID=29780 RepID=UPI001CF95312|nr:histone-lysine N-methyltransferase ATXR4 isoform X3 [Mangifera indica]